jgi:uncharacterized protein
VALIGANGAGKTTLIMALVGIIASKGEVLVHGLRLEKQTVNEIRRRVGVVFQNPDDQLFMPTIGEDVAFGPRNLGIPEEELGPRVEACLNRLHIGHLRHRSALKLSGGEKRMAALATVLAMEPSMMLFDEPSAFLDPKARRNLIGVLSGLSQTKLIATHDLCFALETCRRSVLLKDGKIFADGPSEALLTDEKIMDACGVEAIGAGRREDADGPSGLFSRESPRGAGVSGGVDSTYLLYAALQCGADVKPYIIKSAFQPRFELRDALGLAERLGVKATVLELDTLSSPAVSANPADRCYHCKLALFGALKERASADGYDILLDGTNASDDESDRPGMRALRALAVRSPLRECALQKKDIRRLSREAGLPTWDKPAYACLATRIPEGRPITEELLRRVENAETALFRLGFSDFRVRVYGEAARLQVPEAQMETVLRLRSEIRENLKPYFEIVLLDLAGR